MTFSLIFADPAAQIVGGAVHSHYPFVGATVLRTRCGVGASLSQSTGDPTLAELLLDELQRGSDPSAAIAHVVATCDAPDFRQLAVINAAGQIATHTGSRCVGATATVLDHDACAIGNMLADRGSISAMMSAFHRTAGAAAQRLVEALRAGEGLGGDVRGRQSAAVLVTHARERWRDVDTRVDDHHEPLAELARLVEQRRRYAVLDDPDVLRGGPALRKAIADAERDRWPEEVRFWLGIHLTASGRDQELSHAWRDLASREPWSTLLQRLREAGWTTPS